MKNRFIIIITTLLLLNSINVFAAKVGIEEGNKAVTFTVKDLEGNSINSEDLLGKTVILHFWASWCPPCKEELPQYNTFYNKYKNENVAFVTVSVDNSKRALQKFLENRQIDFNVYHDKSGVSRKFLVRAIPTTFVIDEKGIIVRKKLGSIVWDRYSFEEIRSGDF